MNTWCRIKMLMANAVKLVLHDSLGCRSVFPQMGGTPFGGLGAPNMEQMAAMGMPGPNMNPQVSTWPFVVTLPACYGKSSSSWLQPLRFFLSGSFCRFPEAHAVHGPKVRNYTHSSSRLWEPVCVSLLCEEGLNNWWHLQIESISGRAELKPRTEDWCIQ